MWGRLDNIFNKNMDKKKIQLIIQIIRLINDDLIYFNKLLHKKLEEYPISGIAKIVENRITEFMLKAKDLMVNVVNDINIKKIMDTCYLIEIEDNRHLVGANLIILHPGIDHKINKIIHRYNLIKQYFGKTCLQIKNKNKNKEKVETPKKKEYNDKQRDVFQIKTSVKKKKKKGKVYHLNCNFPEGKGLWPLD